MWHVMMRKVITLNLPNKETFPFYSIIAHIAADSRIFFKAKWCLLYIFTFFTFRFWRLILWKCLPGHPAAAIWRFLRLPESPFTPVAPVIPLQPGRPVAPVAPLGPESRISNKLSRCMTITIYFYPVPGRGRGIVIERFLSFFLCLFISCQQHYEKTAGPICMKFSGKVWSDHGTTWFNFGSIRVNG